MGRKLREVWPPRFQKTGQQGAVKRDRVRLEKEKGKEGRRRQIKGKKRG